MAKKPKTKKKPQRHVHIYLGWEAFWATGEKLFGKNMSEWKFQCPQCGGVLCASEFCNGGPADLGVDDAVLRQSGICSNCGNKPTFRDLGIPHSARFLFVSEGEDIDLPIFDFYRGGENKGAADE